MFIMVNAFLLVSVCSTVHMVLSNWARGPKGERVKGGPKYSNLEASDVVRTFEGKMREFERQVSQRQTRVLEMITKQVRAHMHKDPIIGHALRTDIGEFADGLAGLESDGEGEGADEHHTSIDSGFGSSLDRNTPTTKPRSRQKGPQGAGTSESDIPHDSGMSPDMARCSTDASSQQAMKSAQEGPIAELLLSRSSKHDNHLELDVRLPSSPPLRYVPTWYLSSFTTDLNCSDRLPPVAEPPTESNASKPVVYLRKADFTGPDAGWTAAEEKVAKEIRAPQGSTLWWSETVQRVVRNEIKMGEGIVFDENTFAVYAKHYANTKYSKHLVKVYGHDMNDEDNEA